MATIPREKRATGITNPDINDNVDIAFVNTLVDQAAAILSGSTGVKYFPVYHLPISKFNGIEILEISVLLIRLMMDL